MATKTFTLSPQGTIGSFTIDGVTVRSKGRIVIQPAPGAKVALVDVVGRQSSDPQDHIIMDGLIGQLTKAGYNIRYATNVREFFDPKARWQEILKNGDTQGLELTDEEKKLAADFQNLYKKFETAFTLPKPAYPFAIDAYAGPKSTLSLRGTTRKTVSNGSGYSASEAVAKRIWARASKIWLDNNSTSTGRLGTIPYETMSGYSRRTEVYANRIEVGCQTIGRRALEQFAVAQGWDFPSA
jgi:hypothetical protein